LRVLVRITSLTREAMLHMNTTYAPGRGPWWASPWGWGQGQCVAIPGGKPRPGTMNFWCEPVGLSPIAPRQGSRPFSEEEGD